MARLYRYANSNEKSGYFVIGDNGNATFQVSPIAQSLFNKLEYDPPVKTREQGPKIPAKLHWSLFDIEWIYTGDNNTHSVQFQKHQPHFGDSESLTDEERNLIKQFVTQHGKDSTKELIDKLDIQAEVEEQHRLATLGERNYQSLEGYISGYMSTVSMEPGGGSVDAVDVSILNISDEHDHRTCVTIIIQASGTNANYRHSITSSVKDGITVFSATEASQSWEEQGRMARHNGYLFDTFRAVSECDDMKFNFNPNEINNEIIYRYNFQQDIALPDSIK